MTNGQSLEQMVGRVAWMSPIHFHILQHFENHDPIESGDYWITAGAIAKNINYGIGYTSSECGTLVDRDILKRTGKMYALTELGRSFLNGDLDPEELED